VIGDSPDDPGAGLVPEVVEGLVRGLAVHENDLFANGELDPLHVLRALHVYGRRDAGLAEHDVEVLGFRDLDGKPSPPLDPLSEGGRTTDRGDGREGHMGREAPEAHRSPAPGSVASGGAGGGTSRSASGATWRRTRRTRSAVSPAGPSERYAL